MLRGIKNALLIYNPIAGRIRGRHAEEMERARQALAEQDIRVELAETEAPGAATRLAQRAVAERRGLVLVCGGDGTINEAVNGLAGSTVPLAVLPGGTANVLAKELGIPWDVHHAARLVPNGSLRRIALGLAVPDDAARPPRYFVCMAGAGPDGALVNAVDLEVKARVGILAYWAEGFKQLATYRFPKFHVQTAERVEAATLVVAGRTRHYGGPVMITTEANLFEDQFEVMTVATDSRLRYAANLLSLVVWKNHRLREDNTFWKTTRLRCEAQNGTPVFAQVDGEPIGRLPVEFRIVPDALTLVVPESLQSR
jgi:YegS/Rv2252/BmrU family lipid kinase